MHFFMPPQLGPVIPYRGTDPDRSSSSGTDLPPAPLEPALPQPAWNGVERRSGQDRRQQDRRQTQQGTLLDTRCGSDRRQRGRRVSDADPWTTLKV